jgi:hypothetical protein
VDIDLGKVPMSRFGTNMAISRLRASREHPEGLYIRSVYMGSKPLFRVELGAGGGLVNFATQPSASSLLLLPDVPGVGRKNSVFAEMCFARGDLLRIRGAGVGMRLMRDHSHLACVVPTPPNRYRILLAGEHKSYQLVPLEGGIHMDAPWELLEAYGMRFQMCRHIHATLLPDPRTGRFECLLQEYTSDPDEPALKTTFEQDVKAAAAEFAAWSRKMPAVPRKYRDAAELAAYVMWSAVAAPEGNFGDPPMLMSKNWMCQVWNWDNLFNAWACSYGMSDLAWRMFRLHLDHQLPSGALGDGINQHNIGWTYCKPPLHGWVLRRMMETSRLSKAQLAQVYAPMAAATKWWLQRRDSDGDGVPGYQHGNDSGWDNATVFDVGVPVESPDLAADLIVQMHALADVAGKIGKAKDATAWRKNADDLLKRLLAHSYKDGRWIAPRGGDHSTASPSDCLLPYQTLILGKLLPPEIHKQMAADLAEPGRFLTPWGLATESLRSSMFTPTGYWRGAIWPPTTLIIVDGLARCGHKALAKDIAKRYCDMCAKSGFAENFHPITGAGQNDPAYTWAASVFLILAHEYL